MPELYSDKNAPIVRVAADAKPEFEGCVVDASFARVHVNFEGPSPPCYAITDAVSLRFCSNSSIEGVEAQGRIIERRELDSSRAYVIQVPPEVARRVLQAEGLRNDYRLETARHPQARARLRVRGGEWTDVILKNISISGAAVLLPPREEAKISNCTETELELCLGANWTHVLSARIVQRRLEGPRANCGMVFEWPATSGIAEVERQLRSWIQHEQVRARSERAQSA
jgi:hypothetical protein